MNIYRANKSFRGVQAGDLVQLSFYQNKRGIGYEVRTWSPAGVGPWLRLPAHAEGSFELISENVQC